MGLLSFFAERQSKALRASPNVLEAMADRQFSAFPLIATPPQQRRIDAVYVEAQNASYGWMYLYNPAVRSVVDYQARNIAQLGLKVFERISDDEREHRGDHPAAQAMRQPNPHTPGDQFIYELISDYLIFDNAYVYKFRGDNGRLLLVRLVPHMVGLIGRSRFTIDGYRIWRADGTSFDVLPEEILHWRGYNPDDPRKGESKLETLREELAADLASRKAVTELHRSGLHLPGWIERPNEAPEWDDVGARRFREDWAAQAADSKRRTPVLEEGMTYKTGGVTPEDAEYIKSRQHTNERVAEAFGMWNCPPRTAEERQQFYADVLPTTTTLLEGALNLHLLIAEYGDDDHYFEFNLDEKLIGDDRLKALTSAAGAPILLRDEARARLNLPALPDGAGQEIVTPMNVTEGGKPSPGVMPVQNPNKPPQDGSHRSGEADQPAAAGKQSLPNTNGHHKAQLVPRRARIDERRNRWAQEYEDILGSHFARQRRSMRAKSLSKVQAVKALDTERWDKELSQDLDEISRRHFRSEGNQAAFRLASEFDAGQGENWLAAKALGSAQDINRTTREHVEDRGVVDAFAYAVSARAAASGKGYATDVAGFATKAALQQSPDSDTRTVTIAGGECDICAEFQGSWAFADVPGWPAYHANCGCFADIDGGGPPGGKALEPATKQANPTVNVTTPDVNIALHVAEGAFKVDTPVNVEPAEVNVTTPDIHVAPAEVNIAEGAFTAPNVTVEASEPAQINVAQPEINVAPAEVHIEEGAVSAPIVNVESKPAEVTFEKGAIHTNVEAPAPADVNINEGALRVDVSPADVNVEAPQAPNVNVEVKGGKTKKTVTFSDGRTAEINESEEDDEPAS